jgi:hypothetical protein
MDAIADTSVRKQVPFLQTEVMMTQTSDIKQLEKLFSSFKPPYQLYHINSFNRQYQEIYNRLTLQEKLRAEEFVDRLISGVERPEWAVKIQGVF